MEVIIPDGLEKNIVVLAAIFFSSFRNIYTVRAEFYNDILTL